MPNSQSLFLIFFENFYYFFLRLRLTYFVRCDIIHLTLNLIVNCVYLYSKNDIYLKGEKMIQQTLFALCDPTRREILKMLKNGSKTAGEIAERFDVSPPAISRHLAVLRDAELVETRREGKFIVYEMRREPFVDLDDWVREFSKEEL